MVRFFSFQRSAVPWGGVWGDGGGGVCGVAGHVDSVGLRFQAQQFFVPALMGLAVSGAFTALFRSTQKEAETSLGIILADAGLLAVLWGVPFLGALVSISQWWQGRNCFPPAEIANYAIVFALAGAGFAVFFHGVRFPLSLWHSWPPIRYGAIVILSLWACYSGPSFLARMAADLSVRDDRRRRLEFFESQTGLSPDDVGSGFVQGLYGFDVPPFNIATDSRGFISATGGFQWYAGLPAPGLLRLGPNGHLDESFPRFPEFPILFSTPRILVARSGNLYLNVGLGAGPAPTRILPNGQIDLRFSEAVGDVAHPQYGPDHMAFQKDGKLLFSNSLRFINEAPIALVRLNPSGTQDVLFTEKANQALEARWGTVRCSRVEVTGDGRILAAVESETGSHGSRLARLLGDGTLDPTFRPPEDLNVTDFRAAPDGRVYVLAAPAEGKEKPGLMRLLEDGRRDPGFAPPALGVPARCFTVQAGGEVLVGGRLTNAAGRTCGLLRFLPDGRYDPDFLPNRNSHLITPSVMAMHVGEDGKIYLSGRFSTLQYLFGRRLFTFLCLTPDGKRDPKFVLP
ncbi:MAG: delta-60 repeat domain-containing protein [Elusimicrobia bacterium]|nr:delta-60 repeat domain-containing protein [Elusimicrobiota bacterium]